MNILTFDVEEWFHLLDFDATRTEAEWGKYEVRIHENVDRILDILDRTDTKATFFIIGWVAKTYPEVVRKIAAKFQIGSHTMNHQLVWQQKPHGLPLHGREDRSRWDRVGEGSEMEQNVWGKFGGLRENRYFCSQKFDNMPQVTIKQLNYLMVFVKMFADRFGLSEKQAFNYLDAHKGFAFVDKHYEAIHTLDFAYAIEDVQEVCRANGGRL